MSPNYPNDYGNSKNCQIKIRFAADQVGSIRFEEFDVESHSTCNYDYLAVHDGDSTDSPLIGSKLCGTSPAGTTLQSTGNVMTLDFHSDSSQARSGFKIHADAGKKYDKHPIFKQSWVE